MGLYEQEENIRGIASVLRKQATISYRHSYHLETFAAASAALERFKLIGDHLGTAEALFLIGSALTMQSKEAEATRFLDEALAIFRAHGNDVGIVQCLERLGEVQRRKGNARKALGTAEEAVGIASRCGDKLGEAKIHIILGVTHASLGNLERGVSTLLVASEMARRIGWEHGVCSSTAHIGRIKKDQGRFQEALEVLDESMGVARRSKFPWRLAQALSTSGACFMGQGRLDEAANAYREAYSVYQGISLGKGAGSSAFALAGVKNQQKAMKSSLFWYDTAIAEYRKLQDKRNLSRCLARKVVVLEEAHQDDEAALHYEASLVLDWELRNSYNRAGNRRKLSKIPKTMIKWESRKRSQLISGGQQTSPLLCDIHRLQRRLPQLSTPSLGLIVRFGSTVDS